MKITLVFPAIGRRRGSRYLRLWQMEPLSMGVLAALTPDEIEVKFYDDRVEPIPYDEPSDLVAMTVETYTARRAYQIASEFRKRKVPVVMGGFHPTLCPDEVAAHAEAVVCGNAENLWPRVVDDFRHGNGQEFYRDDDGFALNGLMPRRDIFRGKKYLPLGLIEAGRGCVHSCEFCAIHRMHRGKCVVGCAAIWDQRMFKQAVVSGYGRSLARMRPVLNLLGAGLAAPGTTLPTAFLSHLAVDNDDPGVLRALVSAACEHARRTAGGRWLLLGLAEGHPLLAEARRFRPREYGSILYAVHPPGCRLVLDDRITHIEIAIL